MTLPCLDLFLVSDSVVNSNRGHKWSKEIVHAENGEGGIHPKEAQQALLQLVEACHELVPAYKVTQVSLYDDKKGN
jgi:hypothetical protein